MTNNVSHIRAQEQPKGWRRLAYPTANCAERLVSRNLQTTRQPPIIVLGPPRSGTSLLYQLLTRVFRFSYICNYAASHPLWPVLTTRMMRNKIRAYSGSFRSEYGATPGLAGPSEGRKLWSWWYGYGLADEQLDQRYHDICRRTIANIEQVVGAPFISKNPDHCNRLRALATTFPSAVYIRLERQPVETGRSLLNARKSYLGAFDRWFGVRPPEVREDDRLSPCEEVARQVYYLEQRIDRDFSDVIAPQQVVTVGYEELCADPQTQIERIDQLFHVNRVEVSRSGEAPPAFQRSAGKPLPEHLEDELTAAISQVYTQLK